MIDRCYSAGVKRRFTEESWRREPWFQALISALRSCKTDQAMGSFLRDVASLSELQSLSERLEIARLLGKGLSYRQVSSLTGASTTTVARVSQFLENGEGGYREILKVHRYHDVRKKKAQREEGKSQYPLREQILNSVDPLEPSVERKSKDTLQGMTPLQKYLRK